MAEWSVYVDFTLHDELSADDALDVMEDLGSYGAVIALARDGKGKSIALHVQADTVLKAAQEAIKLTTSTIKRGIEVVGVEVKDLVTAEKEALAPTFPEVVGYAEIAAMAGVTRQRARMFPKIDTFPSPVITTAQGPLYAKSAVEAWIASRSTSAGRPKKR